MWQYSSDLAHKIVVQLQEQPSTEVMMMMIIIVHRLFDFYFQEKKFNLEIGGILDMGLYQLDFSNNSELDTTRRKLVSYVVLCGCVCVYMSLLC